MAIFTPSRPVSCLLPEGLLAMPAIVLHNLNVLSKLSASESVPAAPVLYIEMKEEEDPDSSVSLLSCRGFHQIDLLIS